MLHTVQKEWQGLWGRAPGERFEMSYWATHGAARDTPKIARIVRLLLAVVAFLIGVCFVFLPLPEFPFFLVAGALLAAESLPVARFLDRTEMSLRARWERLKARFSCAPLVGKVLIGVLSFGALAGSSLLRHALRA